MNPYQQTAQQPGWPPANINQQMANMNLGPPKTIPQQQQQFPPQPLVNNNNPPQNNMMMPPTSGFPVNNNNYNQLPPTMQTNGVQNVQNGPPMPGKPPVSQQYPTNVPPQSFSPQLQQQQTPLAAPPNMHQISNQQGQRPPIPGGESANQIQNGQMHGVDPTQMPPLANTVQQMPPVLNQYPNQAPFSNQAPMMANNMPPQPLQSPQNFPGMPPPSNQPQQFNQPPFMATPQQPQRPMQQQPGMPPMPGQFNQQQYPQQPMPGQQHQQFQPPAGNRNLNQPPGMPGFPQQPGYPASQMQAAAPQKRLDPDQMPNPIQVMAENQRASGGPFSTLQIGQVPPLVTTSYITQDQGNSGPRYIRSTMYNIPANTDIMKQSAIPFALIISPFAKTVEQEMAPPIVDFGEIGPIRCIRCKAYMSPHMQFVDAGRRFQCLLCKATTEVPPEYFQHLDHTGQRVDKYERPELVLGTYEFIATKDYCRNNTLPKPPAMIFVIDVSYNNVKSGLVHLLCSQMKRIIRNLPIDQGQEKTKMRVGFITYDKSVHFYNIKSTLAQPQQLVVGDIQEMFMPLLDGFLADPEESEAVIDQLMEQIPKMYGETRETETILMPAIQGGLEALKASECAGKLLIFHSTLPIADAPGQLKNRDDRKLLGTEKERTVLTPQNNIYNNLGQDCSSAGCSVDLFVFNNAYIDLATIGQVSRLTGGEVFKYTYFQSDIDGERLIADICKNIARPIAFDSVMRVRTSTGTRPTDFYGHFFMSNTTDMEIASIDCDKSVAVEVKHDDKLAPEENVYIQVATLYTSCGGQRRLRVLNLALKTCTQLADLFRSCDLDTLTLFLAKQGISRLLEHTPKIFRDNLVNRAAQILACYRKNCASPTSAGQLILPECLKLLPLYISCLLKNDAFSGGSDITLDDRSYSMYFVCTMDLPTSVIYFYPRLIPIHNVNPEEDSIPSAIRCTIDKMTDDGAYILDNGVYMFLWLGIGLSSEFTQSVFGAPCTQQIDTERSGLPIFDNPLSKRVRGIVETIQKQRTRCMRIALVRQRDKLESVLRHFLIEDRGTNGSDNRNYYNGEDDFYRKRDRNYRDDGYYSSNSRRRKTRSRSRSRDKYNNDINEEEQRSNRDKHYNDRRNKERNRDRRDYDRRDNSHRATSRHYESGEESDGGAGNYGNEPNNKVIVRGLPPHITEADIQCDLIQCGLKAVSIRLIRKKSTGVSRGFCFIQFSSIEDARSWIEKKQGVLILQDQHRASIQYSFMKDNDGQYDKVQTDWYCGKCGVFNFKRRENCFKCNASREESGSEGFDEISTVLTKKIMFRNLDALSTEETVLVALQEKLPDQVSKISKILICRDPLTQVSRGICYLNFDNLVDSMNTYQAIEKLSSLQIDGREVSFSYCVDSENRSAVKSQNNGNRREINPSQSNDANYSQTYQTVSLKDVPQLAEQAANMYAQNPAEKESYIKYYTEYYTNQINSGNTTIPSFEANSGASIAQSAIERKQKMKMDTTSAAPYPAQQVETPRGLNDGKKYPTPDVSQFYYDETSGFYFDTSTGLYYHNGYYYNSELGQYLYWDAQNSTYVLAPQTSDVASTPSTSSTQQDIPPPPEEKDKDKKQKDQPQDKVKVAKKIVKDMEKWAKQLNQKKDYTPVQQSINSDNSQSPPSMSTYKTETAVDIGFSMLEKKDRPLSIPITTVSIPNKVVDTYHSDSDEDQAANKSSLAASSFNEHDLVDYDKLTCLLCKRAFPSPDVLNKHVKLSNLHKENLQKYKLQNGILDIGSSGGSVNSSAQSYRDRAKERRMKYGEADPIPPVNRAKERFQREMEKKASLVQSYQAQTIASKPIDDSNIGNKLLKAMGWKEGSGLGKSQQGRTDIIEAEQRNSTAGLGSKNASYGAGPQDDYKSYIKKMMKKRYEEVG